MTNVVNANDWLSRLIRGCISAGCRPRTSATWALTAVEDVAAIICTNPPMHGAINIVAPLPQQSLEDLLPEPIPPVVPHQDWLARSNDEALRALFPHSLPSDKGSTVSCMRVADAAIAWRPAGRFPLLL